MRSMHGSRVPADCHEDAFLAGKRLSWIRVSARGCFHCLWVLSEGVPNRVGADGMGFVKPQRASACT